MHQVHHPDQVDVDGVDPGLHRETGREWGDARVGDDDVEAPEFADAGIDGGGQADPVAHIGDRRVGALTFLFDQARGFVEVLRTGEGIAVGLDVLTEVDGDDVGALGCQHSGV